MLSKANVGIESFIRFFSANSVEVAFLVPTETGMAKSILDATENVRSVLLEAGIHDYQAQDQGPEHKVVLPAYFLTPNRGIETSASLYRPITKSGDPRIWFRGLSEYANPYDLLAIIPRAHALFVINCSREAIASSLFSKGYVYQKAIGDFENVDDAFADLLAQLRAIGAEGFHESVTQGDTAVGDTLEHLLHIERNPLKTPDYRGIEIKAFRKNRKGKKKPATRITLFSQTPDDGMTYREILKAYGKIQIPRGRTEERLQIYETLSTQRSNSYGLKLKTNDATEYLQIVDEIGKYVSGWSYSSIKRRLKEKHPETVFVEAESIADEQGNEMFRYASITHTKHPNLSQFIPLVKLGYVTVDLVAHENVDGTHYRDHGMLFKTDHEYFPLLFGEEEVLSLI